MRTIKFRAWDKDVKKWFYFGDNADVKQILYHLSCYESWGQFTGFLDRDGKEIYEGDIIEYIGLKFSVGMDKYGPLFLGDGDEKYWNRLLPFSFMGELVEHYIVDTGGSKVIGNIYENPELLHS